MLCEVDDENGKCITPPERYNQEAKKNPEAKEPKVLKLSKKGLDFYLGWEYFVPHLYNDGLVEGDKYWADTTGKGIGHCTIGFGFLVHTGPCDGSPSEKRWKNGMDEPTALIWLQPRIAAAEKTVRDNVKVKITQSQFDALVSLELNWGKVKGSKALAFLNRGNYYDAALTIDGGPYTSDGKYMPGLEQRRHEEADMFLYGIYP
jgi:GH24 family phage-related lysozyme (muramidase)